MKRALFCRAVALVLGIPLCFPPRAAAFPGKHTPQPEQRATEFAAAIVGARTAPDRVDVSIKGSLLIYSNVELRWDAEGNLIQDTVLEITNDGTEGVFLQCFFINGDDLLAEIVVGDPPIVVERAHPGCNNVGVQFWVTPNQPLYWSAATGLPLGVQPFEILDPGPPPGRPDPYVPGERMLRGYFLGWAVNVEGYEVEHNHLTGAALIYHFADGVAWEYGAYAFRCINAVPDGILNLDGLEYDRAAGRLLLDFYAVGAMLGESPLLPSVSDTSMTLHPVTADLRQETEGPFTTKAKCDVWNMNEFRFSGTERCITCWDQVLLSHFMDPAGGISNHFLLEYLQTNKGKARIDGESHEACDAESLAILGVAAKVLSLGGAEKALAGMHLTVQGEESATILWDIVEPPEELRFRQEQRDYSLLPAEKPASRPSMEPRRLTNEEERSQETEGGLTIDD